MNITNIKYTVDGMLFDAAVDWDWGLHLYNDEEKQDDTLAIELYNCDNHDWDIHMIYQSGRDSIYFDDIIEKTKEWIKKMAKNENQEV